MAVIGFALGVGAIVFAISLRGGDETLALHPGRQAAPEPKAERRPPRRPRAVGFATSETLAAPPAPEPAESFTYIPVSSDPLTWRTRLGGLAGLVATIALAAAVFAVTVYEAGHLLNQTIAKFLGK